jgi:hypothetical protein
VEGGRGPQARERDECLALVPAEREIETIGMALTMSGVPAYLIGDRQRPENRIGRQWLLRAAGWRPLVHGRTPATLTRGCPGEAAVLYGWLAPRVAAIV